MVFGKIQQFCGDFLEFEFRCTGDELMLILGVGGGYLGVFGLCVLLLKALKTNGGVSFQAPVDISSCGFRHKVIGGTFPEIVQSRLGFKTLGVIAKGGGKHVTDIFGGVFPGHRHHDDVALEPIAPIFPMVRIAFGVVLAYRREIPVLLPLVHDGGVTAVIVFRAREEFLWMELGEVMSQGMEENTAMARVCDDPVAVTEDETKVFERVTHLFFP